MSSLTQQLQMNDPEVTRLTFGSSEAALCQTSAAEELHLDNFCDALQSNATVTHIEFSLPFMVARCGDNWNETLFDKILSCLGSKTNIVEMKICNMSKIYALPALTLAKAIPPNLQRLDILGDVSYQKTSDITVMLSAKLFNLEYIHWMGESFFFLACGPGEEKKQAAAPAPAAPSPTDLVIQCLLEASSLSEIHLSSTTTMQRSVMAPTRIPELLSNDNLLSSLEVLVLANLGLGDEHFQQIAQALCSTNSRLCKLNLGGNRHVTEKGLGALADALRTGGVGGSTSNDASSMAGMLETLILRDIPSTKYIDWVSAVETNSQLKHLYADGLPELVDYWTGLNRMGRGKIPRVMEQDPRLTTFLLERQAAQKNGGGIAASSRLYYILREHYFQQQQHDCFRPNSCSCGSRPHHLLVVATKRKRGES